MRNLRRGRLLTVFSVVAIIGALLPAGLASATHEAAPAGTDAVSVGAPICARPANQVVATSIRATADSPLNAEEWIAGDAGQAAVRRLNDALAPLGSQVLGVVPDHDAQRVIVIIDSGQGDSAATLSALQSDLGKVAPELNPEIRTSCQPRAGLDATMADLQKTDALGITNRYAFGIDAATAKVVVTASTDQDRATIAARYPDTVTIGPGQPGDFSGSRTVDASPHYGDAAIGDPNTGVNCSANFSFVSNAFGTQVTATAAHCGGGSWFSGWNIVGDNVFSAFPTTDSEMLYRSGETHTNKIYTDPGAPTTRNVTGEHDPGLNEYVCADGAQTLSQCTAYVINTNYVQCYNGACWSFLQLFMLAVPGFPECDRGDSGGVVYQRSGTSNAIANGMINSGTTDSSGNPLYGFGGYDCWVTRISQLESSLNVTLRTTP